jgi:hypothetical protein
MATTLLQRAGRPTETRRKTAAALRADPALLEDATMPPRPCSAVLLSAVLLAALSASAGPPAEAPRDEVLAAALRGYACARAEGVVQRPMLGVIDYTLPSTEPRLWLIDARSGRVERSALVSHGRGSGGLRATRFSNVPESHRSSLGLFVTGRSYTGRHGRSLRLYGLEPGVNDLAYERAIVVHGAWYATAKHAARYGRLGRSHGCPAVAPDVAPAVLDALEDGAVLFVYGDDPTWLRRWRGDDACQIDAELAQEPDGSSSSSIASLSSRP